VLAILAVEQRLQPLEALQNAGGAPVPPALQAAADLRVRQKKAFGYTNRAVGAHYIAMVLLVVLLGAGSPSSRQITALSVLIKTARKFERWGQSPN
jgi:hypothetical protein